MSGIRIRGKMDVLVKLQRVVTRGHRISLVADYLLVYKVTGYQKSGLWLSDSRILWDSCEKPMVWLCGDVGDCPMY